MPLTHKEDRAETIKYLSDLNEYHKTTPFSVLQENYVEQLRAVLNYSPIIEDIVGITGIGGIGGMGNLNGQTLSQIIQQLNMGFVIKTVNENYVLINEDFNNRTLIRANSSSNQTVTITKPEDSYIGKSLTIRKTNGDVGTFVNLLTEKGVHLSPQDSTILRRVGSTVTLIYIGEGLWDIFGELP